VSTTVRVIGGATDDLIFAPGDLSGMTFGTIALLFKPWSVGSGGVRTLFAPHDSGGSSLGSLTVDAADDVSWTAGGVTSSAQTLTMGVWYVLVARKATGTATPRFSLLNLSTSNWTHSNGDASVADWTAPTDAGRIRLSNAGAETIYAWIAAEAAWSNSLPWSADASGDSAIEAAGLEDHFDNWRDASPSALWKFNQSSVTHNVEDVSAGLADEVDRIGTGVSEQSDLTFPYESGGLAITSRNYFRTTQNEPDSTGIVRDLSETQGTPTTLGSGNVSGGFVEVYRFHRVVDDTVGTTSFPTQLDVSAVSAATLAYRWRVQRWNSSNVLQASSAFAGEQNTIGIKLQTFALDTTWSAGDRLALSVELRKVSGGGSRNITLNVNDADAWVEFEVALVPPLDITPAAVTVDAAPGTLTISSTVGIVPAAVTITATPGTATITATAAITPAAATVTATPGTVVVATEGGAQPVTPAPVTVTCTAGTLTLTTGAVNVVPDPATITATPGTTVVTTGAVDVIPAEVTVSATPGTLTLTATADIVPAAETVTASPGTLTVTTSVPGQDITPDPVTITVTGGTLAVGQGLAVFPNAVTVTADPGVLTMTTGAVDITPAAVSLTATPGTLVLDVLGLGLTLDGASVTIAAGVLTVATDQIIGGTLVATAPRSGLVATAPTATMGGR
jgi:hypothetical protein